jgi:hypothetical protein
LARAEKLARTSQSKIGFGDFKTVMFFSIARRRSAATVFPAPRLLNRPKPAPQLMQLR